jgi:hypothetical protein
VPSSRVYKELFFVETVVGAVGMCKSGKTPGKTVENRCGKRCGNHPHFFGIASKLSTG